MIENRDNLKSAQTTTKSAVDKMGLRYIVDSEKNQIKIFNKSDTQIGIYKAKGLNNPMAIETIGRYFWITDTGNNRVLLFRAPHHQEP